MTPTVSVVIPTYDRQELTERAIASVRTRFPRAVEIVVVDDAGPVSFSLEVAGNRTEIAISVIRLEVNGGPGLARKAGVEAAKGSVIAFLDSDDEFAEGWLDCLIESCATPGPPTMIVGIVENPQRVAGLVSRVLRTIPQRLQLGAARLVTVFFNPFYTPSIAITRESTRFHDRLRYCEDYYMTTVSLFQVDRLLLPEVTACRLGRPPNSPGGETSANTLMHAGEVEARRAIAREPSVPLWRRILYPVGRAYQGARNAAKAKRR